MVVRSFDDDAMSIDNPDFQNYLGQMYQPELEIKDKAESNTSASLLDLLLRIGWDGQLCTFLYKRDNFNRDNFNFHITNFPFLSSNINIPASPHYGVFISQLIQYARACSIVYSEVGATSLLTSWAGICQGTF